MQSGLKVFNVYTCSYKFYDKANLKLFSSFNLIKIFTSADLISNWFYFDFTGNVHNSKLLIL